MDLLPVLNANILKYLCRFLRELSESGHVSMVRGGHFHLTGNNFRF